MALARIQYEEGTPADAMADLVAATRAGLRDAATYWDDEILDDHFEAGAAAKYGYTPRSGEGEPAYLPSARGIVVAGGKSKYGRERVKQNPSYYWRKAREGYGTVALVRTGATKRMALAGGRVGTSVNGTVVEAYDAIPVPDDSFFKRPPHSRVDKPRELTTTTPAEEDTLARLVETKAAEKVERTGRRQTKQVG